MRSLRKLIERLLLHPKTTIAGVIMITLMILFIKGVINEQKLAVIVATLTGTGLLISKDPKDEG